MTRLVQKRDGRVEPFKEEKILKWARFSSSSNRVAKEIYQRTLDSLPLNTTSAEIHFTMISVCTEMKTKEAARVAAVLENATIARNIRQQLYLERDASFEFLFSALLTYGYWSEADIPAWNPRFEDWYEELSAVEHTHAQVLQWVDKYSIKVNGEIPIETIAMGAIGLGLAIHGDTLMAYRLAKAIVNGTGNLPTPVVNGCRNGDWDTISCCVIQAGDTVASIGVGEHVAYTMTAKKAGIGYRLDARSEGNAVKGGRITHLGKVPILKSLDSAVKMFTQVGRGGSATVTLNVYDPDIISLMQVKSQKTVLNKRIDTMDYSLAYDDAFVKAVKADGDIQTVSVTGELGPIYKARFILKRWADIRSELGRLYCINLSTINKHTPFTDYISQSNLCMEIALPTLPFKSMQDLYSPAGSGEVAFCSLAATNVTNVVTDEEFEDINYVLVSTVDKLIDKVSMFAPALYTSLQKRRSLGIGITGLAGGLANRGLKYSDALEIERIAEQHYYFCLKASQQLVREGRAPITSGIDPNWLPIDTMTSKVKPRLNWEILRGKPRRNSVLCAQMPTETSSGLSGALNGLYPARKDSIKKQTRSGLLQVITPENVTERAWDIPFKTMANVYAAVQNYTDQAISVDYFETPSKLPGGKISLANMMKQFVYHNEIGNKTMYYLNINDDNGGSFADQIESGCADGVCKI